MRHTRSIRRAALLVLAAAVTAPLPAADEDSPSAAAIERGQQRYMSNCSACHGPDGKGLGPMLSALNKKPSNLTTLTRNNGGQFPLRRLYDSIDGRNIPETHGSREMPVWGEEFKARVAQGSETLVRGRILELLMYLDSIQQN